MNIQQALDEGKKKLSLHHDSAYLDTQILLCFVLKKNSAYLLTWPENNLTHAQATKFKQLITKRQQGHPIAHLTEQREFFSLNFAVNNSTLIPRPDTELLVEYVLEKFANKKNIKLLDLGSGTGVIAICIAKHNPQWEIFASDVSIQALTLAKHNSQLHHIENINFIHSHWFESITQKNFDIIISNPPYIAENDPHLNQGDVRFEPNTALIARNNGLADILHITQEAKNYLAKNGQLIIEHGYNQAVTVKKIFNENRFKKIGQKKDLSHHFRMTTGVIVR